MKNRTSILVLISLTVILGSSFAFVNASTTRTVVIGLGKQQSVTINLQEKEIVTGSFNISNSREIDFWVRDPSGNIIVNSGTVVGNGNFEFTATNQGNYVLNFKNNDNTRSRTVYLEYSVNYPPIIQQPPEILRTDQIAIAIVLSLAVIVVIIGVITYKQRAKRKNRNP